MPPIYTEAFEQAFWADQLTTQYPETTVLIEAGTNCPSPHETRSESGSPT